MDKCCAIFETFGTLFALKVLIDYLNKKGTLHDDTTNVRKREKLILPVNINGKRLQTQTTYTSKTFHKITLYIKHSYKYFLSGSFYLDTVEPHKTISNS